MSCGLRLDHSLGPLEETRFKKKHSDLIQALTKKYHFTLNEVESLLLMYYKLQKVGPNKNEGMAKRQLEDIFHSTFDMTDIDLMGRICYSLDKSPSPILSMESWVRIMSLLLRGSLEEKVAHCYGTYDMMGDGAITRDTMIHLLRYSLYSQGDEDMEETVKDLVEVLTKKLDVNRDAKITFEDYKETVLGQPLTLEMLGQCLPSRLAVHAFVTSFTTNVGKL